MYILLALVFGAMFTLGVHYTFQTFSFYGRLPKEAPEIWRMLGEPRAFWHKHPFDLHRFLSIASKEPTKRSEGIFNLAKLLRRELYCFYGGFAVMVSLMIAIWACDAA